MYKLLLILSLISLIVSCSNDGGKEQSQNKTDSSATKIASKDTSKKSIPSEAARQIGEANIRINYHSPAVRGRVIWGGLVPYNTVWVTGAHKATTLEVSKNFAFGGKNIPAGKYAIFTIPAKDEWTIILNKRWDQHLADEYSEAEDLSRFRVKPQVTSDTTERLKYSIEQKDETLATIVISWEKLRVPFDIKIK